MDQPLRVLVSAGASGIGASVVERFRADGARVSICDRDEIAVTAATRSDPELLAVVGDVADADDTARWVAEVVERWGGVDVLVNNAGIAGPTARVEEIDPVAWRECLAVNLDSHFLMARLVVPHMKRQGSGAIVTISSTAGLFGYGMRTPYAASKWAVIGLTKSLAVELGPFGIRANVVAPGSVEGPRMGRVIEAEAAQRGVTADVVEREYVESQSIPRFVKPSEIADMCAFLASPRASMVNGQVIAVDGHTETFHIATR
ncbi:MAG TPA: SDR family oxidoreductase [Nocardioides sp.]|jgi:NAD(P)-dependent dehydrogenase (short-subunit alcohol dehydrogenase family)|nr:SDR family oxidoreductase [Nocardioides sp.]